MRKKTLRQDFNKLGLDPEHWQTIVQALTDKAQKKGKLPKNVIRYHPEYDREALRGDYGDEKVVPPMAALWGYLIWSALKRLKLRTKGLGKLVDYFGKAQKYEHVLYGTGSDYYRAHQGRHLFAVFIHGWKLLSDDAFLGHVNLFNRDFSDFYRKEQSHKQHTRKGDGEPLVPAATPPIPTRPWQAIFKEDEQISIRAAWVIASLCHDLGYPLERTSEVNKHVRAMLGAYGGTQMTDLGYSSNFGQEHFFASLLEGLGHVAHGIRLNIGNHPMVEFRTQQVMLAKRKAAYIEMDHGIASALLVWKTLEGLSDILIAPHGPHALSADRCRKFILVREALAAIADHNNKHLYSRHCNLAFLLRVCDEASERFRPTASTLFTPVNPGPKIPPPLVIVEETINFSGAPKPTLTVTYKFKPRQAKNEKEFNERQDDKRVKLSKTLGRHSGTGNLDARTVWWQLRERFVRGNGYQWKPLHFRLEKEKP
jgi:hypothetical protein